ncbi:Uncharacterised protein [Escherichia coli]|nr:Uncharacterised protein [Escherichia coli]
MLMTATCAVSAWDANCLIRQTDSIFMAIDVKPPDAACWHMSQLIHNDEIPIENTGSTMSLMSPFCLIISLLAKAKK